MLDKCARHWGQHFRCTGPASAETDGVVKTFLFFFLNGPPTHQRGRFVVVVSMASQLCKGLWELTNFQSALFLLNQYVTNLPIY